MEPEQRRELAERFREVVRATIRAQPLIPFHRDSIFEQLPKWIREECAGSEKERTDVRTVIAEATETIQQECPSLRIGVRENLCGIDLSIHGRDGEWSEILAYGHGTDAASATRVLSTPAAELLERIENGELTEPRSELSVRHRIGLFGYSTGFAKIQAEIKMKRGIEIEMQESGDRSHQRRHMLRFSIKSRKDSSSPVSGYSPRVPADCLAANAFKAFRQWFYEMLMNSSFSGTGPFAIWTIATRREFFSCFPQSAESDKIDANTVLRHLHPLQTGPEYRLGWDLSYDNPIWSVSIVPTTSWETTRGALREELARPTPEAQFNLGPEAATLYEWIRSLHPSGLELGLTPHVEAAMREGRLPLKSPWSSENFMLFVSLLCEQITDRTAFDIRPVEWKGGYSGSVRIRVKTKPQQSQ